MILSFARHCKDRPAILRRLKDLQDAAECMERERIRKAQLKALRNALQHGLATSEISETGSFTVDSAIACGVAQGTIAGSLAMIDEMLAAGPQQ